MHPGAFLTPAAPSNRVPTAPCPTPQEPKDTHQRLAATESRIDSLERRLSQVPYKEWLVLAEWVGQREPSASCLFALCNWPHLPSVQHWIT